MDGPAPACALCGGPVRADDGLSQAGELYCCTGCVRVAEILRSSGHRGDPRESAAWLASVRAGLVPVDGPARSAAELPEHSGEQRNLRLGVEGMWCPSCGWLVEQVLEGTAGVHSAQVAFVSDQLELRYDPTVVGPEQLRDAVEGLGYRVVPRGGADQRRLDRGLLLRFGVAAFLTANVMAMSYALYAHRGAVVTEQAARMLPFFLMALAAPVVFGAGSSILWRAWRALRSGGLTMDSLIALGSVSAFGYSAAAAFMGSEDVYFDGACAVITFWLLGRLLEQAAFRRANQAGAAVQRLLPRKARQMGPDGARWVPTERLTVGDIIRVAPGERVPVDARVVEGRGHVSTAVVDGEPRARTVHPGSEVPGGSSCGEASLDLEVRAPASDSMLARIAEHVALATGSGGETARIIDAIARLFVPFVLVLAVVTGAGWMATGLALPQVFERALTVLVVSCPCALGVAAPLARVITAGALARRGILARDQGALDHIATARWAAFDKTGTLTGGRLDLVWHRAEGIDARRALPLLRALERSSAHPVAEALRRAVPGGEERAEDIEVVSGLGVRGRVGGIPVRIGRCGWVQEQAGRAAPLPLLEALSEHEGRGHTAVLACAGAEGWLALAFDDPPRHDAAAMVRGLQGAGMELAVLSGDAQCTTARLAEDLGIPQALGGCLPEDKARWLEAREREKGQRAVFVGDGINDAPAMASAVGVAVSSGTDFARETAAVLLLEPDLGAVADLVQAARRMRRVTIGNLAWAGLYNAVALPAAVLGLLNPVLAAAAMVGSGLAVTVNALRLRSAGSAPGLP